MAHSELSKLSPSPVTTDDDSISNTLSIDRVSLASTPTTVRDVIKDSHNGKKDELPTGAIPKNAHQKRVMNDVVNTKDTQSDQRYDDNDSDELAKELNEPAE